MRAVIDSSISCLKLLEGGVDLVGRAALLVDGENAPLEIDTGLDAAQHFVGGTEDAVEEVELLGEQLVDAAVGLVALVEEVDDDDVVLLPVAVAAADALLDALRVPRQVVVDDQRAELQVDAFGRRLGGDHHGGIVAEMLDQCRAAVDGARTR